MSKIIILCAVFAVARAGLLSGPAVAYQAPTYSHYSYAAPSVAYAAQAAPLGYAAHPAPLAYAQATPLAVHAPAIGTSHQSTVRSLDGNSAISHYSKSVDTAFSSVRKVDTRVTNDAKIITPAVAYAPAYVKAAPVVAHAAPVVAHAASYAAPYAYASHAAPYAYAAAPASHVVSAHTTFSGLGATYAF